MPARAPIGGTGVRRMPLGSSLASIFVPSLMPYFFRSSTEIVTWPLRATFTSWSDMALQFIVPGRTYIRHTVHLVERSFNKMSDINYTAATLAILEALARDPETSLHTRKVAEKARVSVGAASMILRTLEGRRLVGVGGRGSRE